MILGGLYFPIFLVLMIAPRFIPAFFQYGLDTAIEDSGVLLDGSALAMIAVFSSIGAAFGSLLGVILGVLEGLIALVVVRAFFFPSYSRFPLRFSLGVIFSVVSYIGASLYFAMFFPKGNVPSDIIDGFLTPPIWIATIATFIISQGMSGWYSKQFSSEKKKKRKFPDIEQDELVEMVFPLADEFQRTDASREP